MLERSVDGNLAVGASVAREFVQVQRAHEKRIEVDIADGHFSVKRKWIGKPECHIAGQFSGAHRRAELQLGNAPVRGQFSVKTSDNFLPDSQIDYPEGAIRFRGRNRATGFYPERDLPVDRKTRRLQLFEIRKGNGRADQIDGDVAIRESVFGGSRNDARSAAGFFTRRK